ncbi:MAG: deoxyribose-phosphate aldolase [Desulfobulbaceae bacterium]|nr:deoxyribose-phosphate aldolase [Desulfobulbaceae bacterium]
MSTDTLAKYFDHTILKPSATAAEVKIICEEAIGYDFFSVCVNPVHVKTVKTLLAGTEVKVCSVVGFPLGAHTSIIKATEAEQAISDGADEIDMVINVGALKDKEVNFVENDIQSVVKAAGGKVVKVIIETCLLEDSEIVEACNLARKAGAHFVKTSTGFAGGGATAEDVALMRRTVGSALQIKASGGIKTLADTKKMIDAGADRIGASAGIAIMKELQDSGNG